MAVTENSYTGNGSTTNYSFTFPYLKSTDIQVQVDQAVTTAWSLANATTVQFNSAPANGAAIKILRDTNVDNLTATFYAGSSIKSEDLNDNFTQNLYVTQEIGNRSFQNTGNSTMIGNFQMGEDTSIIFEGATDNAYETTLTVTDPTADRTITLPNTTGTVITTGDTGTVTVGMMGTNSVDSDELVADSVITAKIADDNVTYAKIQNVSATDRVLGRDSSGAGIIEEITPANLRTMINVEDGATADQTNAEIRTAVEAASDSNVFTDADHTKLNSVESSADVTDATNVNAAGAVMNSDTTTADMQFVVDEDNFSSDLATKVPTQQSTKAYITTTSQPKADRLTQLSGIREDTAGKLIEDVQLTSTIAKLNLLSDKTIETTIAANATDVQIPTAQAVNERVVELVTEVGGFHPIANETSFPTTNPDINDGAGTIVSIKALTSAFTTGSGVTTHTFTNGAGSGNNVTITGLTASTTYPAGRGMLLETTTTSGDGSATPPRAYTYHRLTLDEAGVANAQTAVDEFNNKYRGSHNFSGGNPSSPSDGDLAFDTNANKMKVYNSSGTSWDVVASSGDFKFLVPVDVSTTTAATWDGSDTSFDLKETTNTGNTATVTSANQLLVSVNGVIQKPNTGSYSASEEGFYLTDGDTIRFCTAPPTGSSVFIIQIGASTTISQPGQGTVGTDQIVNNTVTLAKLQGIARGKIIYGDASGDPALLTVGSNGQVLQSDGTDISWQNAAAGATGGNSNSNKIFWENEQTVTHDYTIQNNHNAGSFGPITINSGITVTVGAGETWTVI